MSKTFTSIRIEGLEKVLRKIDKMDKFASTTIDLELDRAADNVLRDAKANAPRGRRQRIVNSLYANKMKFRKTVGAGAKFAAFAEFGTGSRVFKGSYSFTPDEKAFARRFYVSGKGRMRSRAYLFPAFRREIPELMKRIRKVFFDI